MLLGLWSVQFKRCDSTENDVGDNMKKLIKIYVNEQRIVNLFRAISCDFKAVLIKLLIISLWGYFFREFI